MLGKLDEAMHHNYGYFVGIKLYVYYFLGETWYDRWIYCGISGSSPWFLHNHCYHVCNHNSYTKTYYLVKKFLRTIFFLIDFIQGLQIESTVKTWYFVRNFQFGNFVVYALNVQVNLSSLCKALNCFLHLFPFCIWNCWIISNGNLSYICT